MIAHHTLKNSTTVQRTKGTSVWKLGIVAMGYCRLFFTHRITLPTSQLCIIVQESLIEYQLVVFNLLPIPPLDGSKVLYSVLPNDVYYWLMRYERYGMILLLLLVWTDLVGSPLSAAVEWSFDKLFNVAQWGFDIVKRFI